MQTDIDMCGKIIAERYRIDRLAGRGSFGAVYLGFDQVDRHLVALKVSNNANTSSQTILRHEHRIYQVLSAEQSPPLIPKIYCFCRL